MTWTHNLAAVAVVLLAAIPAHAAEIVVQQPPLFEGGIPLDCRRPAYPVEALRYELEGETIVEFLINEEGKVNGKRVVKSSDWKMLDDLVLSSLGACRFSPVTHDGKPVGEKWVKQSFVWTLTDPGESTKSSLPVLLPASCQGSEMLVLTDDPHSIKGILMRFLVSPNGSAFGIKVERRSADAKMNDAAVALLQSCKFEPFTRHGTLIPGNGFASYKMDARP